MSVCAHLTYESLEKYGGKYVINPSGGLEAKGHPLGATGLAMHFSITSTSLTEMKRGPLLLTGFLSVQLRDCELLLCPGLRRPFRRSLTHWQGQDLCRLPGYSTTGTRGASTDLCTTSGSVARPSSAFFGGQSFIAQVAQTAETGIFLLTFLSLPCSLRLT